jgi:hypothetical protein
MVEWSQFIAALREALSIDDDTAKQFQYILGIHYTK